MLETRKLLRWYLCLTAHDKMSSTAIVTLESLQSCPYYLTHITPHSWPRWQYCPQTRGWNIVNNFFFIFSFHYDGVQIRRDRIVFSKFLHCAVCFRLKNLQSYPLYICPMALAFFLNYSFAMKNWWSHQMSNIKNSFHVILWKYIYSKLYNLWLCSRGTVSFK